MPNTSTSKPGSFAKTISLIVAIGLAWSSRTAWATYPDTLTESFSSSSVDACLVGLNPSWDSNTAGYNEASSGLSFSSGHMTMTTSSSPSHAGKFTQFCLYGDFDIWARIQRPSISSGGCISLGIYDSINNTGSAIVLDNGFVWRNAFYPLHAGTDGYHASASNSESVLDLRMVRVDDTISFYYKTPAAGSWTALNASSNVNSGGFHQTNGNNGVQYTGSDSPVYVGVYAQTWTSSVVASGYVDELSISGTFKFQPLAVSPASQHLTAAAAGPATMSVSMDNTNGSVNPAQGSFTYQWQVETATNTWVNLTHNGNGRSGSSTTTMGTSNGGRISTLSIANYVASDTSRYRCIVSNGCSSVTSAVSVFTVGYGDLCSPADIADDGGDPLPTANPNGGVNEGDYNAFFMGYFDAYAYCDIANDDGTPLPPFGPSGGTNNGVNEGDYNCFFIYYFDGCL